MVVLRSARQAVFLLFSVSLFFAPVFLAAEDAAKELSVDALRRRITGEAPAELVGLKLGDADVSLQMAGYWKGTLQGNLGFAVSPLGTQMVSPDSPVLYTQEADLTLSLWILDRWFVEANFLDNTSLNTYRAGFQGLPGEMVQYAGIGNTGLDFPAFPYLDLGGDSPSSFGFYSRLGSENLTVHTLFRYDAAAREERTFVGSRERSYAYVSPQNPARGISFVLPDDNLDSEPVVYLEDEKGTLLDSGNRRWRLAAPSEYAAGRTAGLVELNVTPKGMVAAAYSKGGNSQPWNSSLGSYTAAGSFLGGAQEHFNRANMNINLEHYPQSGEKAGAPHRPGGVVINGTNALVVYEPGTFSPFERQSRYEAPSSAAVQAALVRLSSGEEFAGYDLFPLDSASVSADIPLYAVTETKRALFELVRRGGGGDRRSTEMRWPLAAEFPSVYLPGSASFTEDLGLRFTSYGSPGVYAIGTDVVSGSVQVWRNGIQDPNFSYNDSGGTVTLASPAGYNEVIRITYLKRSDETRLGSIAAGFGAVYHKEYSPFTSALALGIRWNLTQDSSFTEEGVSNPGAVALSAKTAWDYDYLKTRITTGLAFDQTDTTGLYRAAGMEGGEIVIALTPASSFVSQPPTPASLSTLPSNLGLHNRASLVYRNYRDNASLGGNLMPIDWGGAAVVSAQNRPYPVKDPRLTSEAQALAAEFTLTPSESWTGFEVPLGDDGALLAQAREIEIPFRFHGFSETPPAGFRLLVQIGSLSSKDIAFAENPYLIFERELFDGNEFFDKSAFDENARIARFVLSDDDRRRLGDARYLRLIVVYTGNAAPSVSGRTLLAPPIVRGAVFRPIVFDGNTISEAAFFTAGFSGGGAVKTAEIPEAGSASLTSVYADEIKRLHPAGGGQQRVLEIQWEGMKSGVSAGADGRISSLALANYRVLSFFARGPELKSQNNGTLRFIIADSPEFAHNGSKPYLEAEIPLSAFTPGKWSKVSVRYQGKDQGVQVDGGNIEDASFSYRPPRTDSTAERPAGRAAYAAVLVNPEAASALPDGNLRIDEIALEEASPLYRLNLGGGVEYTRQGSLLAIGKIPVLADFSVSTALEGEARGDPFTEGAQAAGGLINRSNAEVSLFGAKLSGNLAFTAAVHPAQTSAEEAFLWSAGHGVSRAFGPFQAGESFSAAPAENSANHRVNLDFASVFYSRFSAEALYELSRLNRKWNLALGVKPPREYIPSLALDSTVNWSERNGEIDEAETYGGLWVRSWKPMTPDLGPGAEERITRTAVTLTEAAKPLGAVITVEGNTAFARANNLTRSGSIVRLDLPVNFAGTSLNFQAGREFKRHLLFSGSDARDDGVKFFESVNDSLPLWRVVPFYSLFAPELNDALDKSLENSPSQKTADYTAFNDRFAFTGRFPSVFDIKAFIIPSGAGLSFDRILEQKMDTRSDVLRLGGNLAFSAVNMFGAMGYLPLFNFYRDDEFTHTLETSVALPRREDLSWRLQSALGANFHGFSGGVLGLANTLTFGSAGWLESLKADWTVPARRSLLSIVYNWIASAINTQSSWLTLSNILNSEYEQLRKETAELVLDYSGDYLRWNLGLGHESIIRIAGRMNFSVFAKLDLSDDMQSKTFSFVGTIGASLSLSF